MLSTQSGFTDTEPRHPSVISSDCHLCTSDDIWLPRLEANIETRTFHLRTNVSNHHKSPARECIICMLSHLGQRWAGVVYLETGNIRSDKKRQIPSDQQKWNAIVTALRHTLSFFLKMLNSKSGLKNQCHGMSIEPTTIPRRPCSLFLVRIKFSPTLSFTFAQQLRLQVCY